MLDKESTSRMTPRLLVSLSTWVDAEMGKMVWDKWRRHWVVYEWGREKLIILFGPYLRCFFRYQNVSLIVRMRAGAGCCSPSAQNIYFIRWYTIKPC